MNNPSVILIVVGAVFLLLALGVRVSVSQGALDGPNGNRPAIVGLLVLGLVCLGFGIWLAVRAGDDKAPTSPNTPPPVGPSTSSPAPRSSSRPSLSARFTSPTIDQDVSQSKGFAASGSVSGLELGTTLWLMDHSGTFAVDEVVSVSGARWSGTDAQLGDLGETLPFKLNVALVAATTTKCQEILNAKVGATDPTIGAVLPAGCFELDEVEVNVSRP